MKRSSTVVFLATTLGLLPVCAQSDEWPTWRGPSRQGTSSDTGLPTEWSATRNILWKLTLPGTSGSTPAVWGDQIYLQIAEGTDLALWAVSTRDGEVRWRHHLGGGNEDKRKGNLSSPSPVTDGRHVWVMTGTGVLSAFAADGRLIWRRNLQQEYGEFGILHGYSSTPLLDKGILYVQVLHGFFTDDPSYVLAIDGLTGKTLWRVERPTDAPKEAPDAYTTPNLLVGDDDQIVLISGGDYVTGHDPATGHEVWRIGGLNPTRNPMQRIVASPVVVDGMVIVPSRVRPLLALSLGTSIRHEPRVAWTWDRGPDVPSPAVHEGLVYLLNDNGILWCLDLDSGDVVWGPKRLTSASYSASPVVADGKLYATSETGVTTVLKAGPEYEVLAVNTIDEYTLASIAIADSRIYLRTADHLYCIDEPPRLDSDADAGRAASP